jgi:uncharacterized protein with HEPN domain
MTEPSLRPYLEHIAEFSAKARGFCEDMTQEQLAADTKTLLAVERALEIAGEAASRVTQRYPQFADQHPEVPWVRMAGMRNRLAHGYFDVQMNVVWEVLTVRLPELDKLWPALLVSAGAYLQSRGPAL